MSASWPFSTTFSTRNSVSEFERLLRPKLTTLDLIECKDRTLETKEGPVTYDEDCSDNEGDEEDPSGDDEQGPGKEDSNANRVATQSKRSALGQLSEYELARERNIERNRLLREAMGLDGGASKIIQSASGEVDKQSEKPQENQGNDIPEKDRSQEEE
jgi:hypothetical protein